MNRIFKSKYFITVLQFLTLIVFVLLIYGSIGITTNDSDFAKILRNTNLPNLIIWSYWWPLIIASAIIFGRYWCTICPMEMVTSFFAAIGLRKKPGNILKSGWVITLFYAMILVLGIHTLAIHRIPQYMAIYMLLLFAVAVIVGLIWEKRTFCTYVCPIGHLLGLYSLLSFKRLGVKNHSVCESCKTHDCIHKRNSYKFIGRSCTSELFPPKITDNRQCILCGQCFKSCTKNNIEISNRSFASDMFTNIKLKWAEIAFFIIVSGFVIYEILSEWSVTKGIVMAVPNMVNSAFDISGSAKGTVKAVLLFVLLPFSFYFVLALLKKIFANESWKNAFSQLVMAILPITASMHLLKALLKTSSRIPYWKYVFSDPEGIETATNILKDSSLINSYLLSSILPPVIDILSIVLSLLGIILSYFVIKKYEHKNATSRAISYGGAFVYSLVFLLSLIIWRL